MDKTNASVILFCLTTLFLCGQVLFLLGFFPTTIQLHDDNEVDVLRPTSIDGIKVQPPARKFPQVILMLVDAMRYDFISPGNVPFTHENMCGNFKIRVDIPTVTMPRIKSLMTGTLSTFIDIIRNLQETEQLKNSLLHVMSRHGDHVNFAGDHTWTQLFPKTFKRSAANVDSFYVNDFHEGDKNVTKTLREELQQSDWSMFILHYLGLDHIGHIEGSRSAKIMPKMKEMDDVVKQIYTNKYFFRQLLLVTADHGMHNAGGHGGSSAEELIVPLVVVKQNCSQQSLNTKEYAQIDLASTLAILLSLEIPKPSIGVLIPELLTELDEEEKLYAFFYNAHHLIEKARAKYGDKILQEAAYYGWFQEGKEAHKQYLKMTRESSISSTFLCQKAMLNYQRTANDISSVLAHSLVHFDYGLVFIGLTLTTMVTVYTLFFVLLAPAKPQHMAIGVRLMSSLVIGTALNAGLHYMQLLSTGSAIKSYFLTLPIAACVFIAMDFTKIFVSSLLSTKRSEGLRLAFSLPTFLVLCFMFHTISFGSSSFIEEEHQTWYYLGATNFVYLLLRIFYQNVKKAWQQKSQNSFEQSESIHPMAMLLLAEAWRLRMPALVIGSTIFLRRLNQTGNKYMHLVDVGDLLLRETNRKWLSLFFVVGLLLLLLRLRRFNTPPQMIWCALAALFIYCCRGINGDVIFFSGENFNASFVLPFFWLCIAITMLLRYKHVIISQNTYSYESKANLVELFESNLTCCLLVCALLQKPHNVILLAAMISILDELYKLCDLLSLKMFWSHKKMHILAYKSLLTIFVAKCFFFYQGNSNSLSTIDLAPGYIGQTSYKPVLVAAFVTMNTYCSYINSFLYMILHMYRSQTSYLPKRQEKEQITNALLVQHSEEDLQLVISLYTALTLLPVSLYLCLMLFFRHHLFIYSVFAPKALYECFNVVVFYVNFAFINFYINLFK